METFLASGVGWGGGVAFQEQQLIPFPSATQGRPNFTVPSFIVATFPTQCSPILSTSIMVGASVPVLFSDRLNSTSSSTAVHSWAQFLAHPGEDRQPNCRRQVCGFMRPVFSQQCSDWAATSPPTSKSRGLWRLFFAPSFFPFPHNKTHDLVIAKVPDCTMKPWSNQKSNFLSFGSHFE